MDFIGFENFRSLEGWHKFDLADITLLTGTNNSGKSSLISAVRILKDGIRGVDTKIRTQQIERPWSLYKIGSIFNIELNNNGDKRSGGFLSTLVNRNHIEKHYCPTKINKKTL
jgi:AAA15 family ATPase/GTPase